MRRLALILTIGLFLISCKAGGGSSTRIVEKPTIGKINIQVDGKDSVLDLKSCLMHVTARQSSDPGYNYAEYGFTLGNFDLMDNKALERALRAGNAEIVVFQLLGPTGSDKDTPLTVGTYSTDAKGLPKFDMLSLQVFTIVNGKQVWTRSKTSPATDTHGVVKITAIEGDLIQGEIDISTGSTLKARGNFIAQRAFDKIFVTAPTP